MSRPIKWRKVCSLPENNLFGPLGSKQRVIPALVMTVDEYETIRLIDLEGMTQEECANKMHIARTTVQAIYTAARKKIADALVNGKRLQIEGGEYSLCNGSGPWCGGPMCNGGAECGSSVCCKRQIGKKAICHNNNV